MQFYYIAHTNINNSFLNEENASIKAGVRIRNEFLFKSLSDLSLSSKS